MRIQLNEGVTSPHFGIATLMCATSVEGVFSMISSSRKRSSMGSAQSRQRALISTSRPGNNQRTASDSRPHWPYHFSTPSTLTRYCVGMFENGAHDCT